MHRVPPTETIDRRIGPRRPAASGSRLVLGAALGAGLSLGLVFAAGCASGVSRRPETKTASPVPPNGTIERSGLDEAAPAPSVPTLVDAAPEWTYWPRQVRIHPLTRIVITGEDEAHLELRLEFLDREGDTTKARGTVEVALFVEGGAGAGGGTPATDPARRSDVVDGWVSDLADPDENRARFDTLTRTYLYKLAVDPRILERSPQVFVRHDCLSGRSFQADLALRTDPVVDPASRAEPSDTDRAGD